MSSTFWTGDIASRGADSSGGRGRCNRGFVSDPAARDVDEDDGRLHSRGLLGANHGLARLRAQDWLFTGDRLHRKIGVCIGRDEEGFDIGRGAHFGGVQGADAAVAE